MYYDLKMEQEEIAQRINFSRSKVSRLLSKANKIGIVEVNVKQIMDIDPNIQRQLKRSLNLKTALPIDDSKLSSYDEKFEAITDFVALYLIHQLSGEVTLGVSGCYGVNQTICKVKQLYPCHLEVVQAMGLALSPSVIEETKAVLQKITHVYDAKFYALDCPLYSQKKINLSANPVLKETFSKFNDCNILLSQVAPFSKKRQILPVEINNYISREQIDELTKKNAVGSICGIYYDINGDLISCDWNKHYYGISYQQIKDVPISIIFGFGENMVKPLLGAVRGGLGNVLITDVSTANLLMKAAKKV